MSYNRGAGMPPPAARAKMPGQQGHAGQPSVANAAMLFGGGGGGGGESAGSDPFSSIGAIDEGQEEESQQDYWPQQTQQHQTYSTAQSGAFPASQQAQQTPRRLPQNVQPTQSQQASNANVRSDFAPNPFDQSAGNGGGGDDDWLAGLSQEDSQQQAQQAGHEMTQEGFPGYAEGQEYGQGQYYDYSSMQGNDQSQQYNGEYSDEHGQDANGYNYDYNHWGYDGQQYDYSNIDAQYQQDYEGQQHYSQQQEQPQYYDYSAYQYDANVEYGYDANAYQNDTLQQQGQGQQEQGQQEQYDQNYGQQYQDGNAQAEAQQDYDGQYDYSQYQQDQQSGQQDHDYGQYDHDYQQQDQQDFFATQYNEEQQSAANQSHFGEVGQQQDGHPDVAAADEMSSLFSQTQQNDDAFSFDAAPQGSYQQYGHGAQDGGYFNQRQPQPQPPPQQQQRAPQQPPPPQQQQSQQQGPKQAPPPQSSSQATRPPRQQQNEQEVQKSSALQPPRRAPAQQQTPAMPPQQAQPPPSQQQPGQPPVQQQTRPAQQQRPPPPKSGGPPGPPGQGNAPNRSASRDQQLYGGQPLQSPPSATSASARGSQVDPFSFSNQQQSGSQDETVSLASVASPPSLHSSAAGRMTAGRSARGSTASSIPSQRYRAPSNASTSSQHVHRRSVVGDDTIIERDTDTPGPFRADTSVGDLNFNKLSLGARSETGSQAPLHSGRSQTSGQQQSSQGGDDAESTEVFPGFSAGQTAQNYSDQTYGAFPEEGQGGSGAFEGTYDPFASAADDEAWTGPSDGDQQAGQVDSAVQQHQQGHQDYSHGSYGESRSHAPYTPQSAEFSTYRQQGTSPYIRQDHDASSANGRSPYASQNEHFAGNADHGHVPQYDAYGRSGGKASGQSRGDTTLTDQRGQQGQTGYHHAANGQDPYGLPKGNAQALQAPHLKRGRETSNDSPSYYTSSMQQQGVEPRFEPHAGHGYAPSQQEVWQYASGASEADVQYNDQYQADYAQQNDYGYYGAPPESSAQQDDPLIRQRANIPLSAFSANGRLITYFPRSGENSAVPHGFASYSASKQILLRKLSNVISPSSYATNLDVRQFPGPLFETASSNSALARATGGNAAQIKTKKAAVMHQLNLAVTEMSSGLSYLTGQKADEGRRVKDRIVLLRILSCLVDHDGNNVGNAAFDKAASDILLQAAETQVTDAAPAQTDSPRHEIANRDFLDQVQNLLSRGERREAISLARDNKMWTHAVIIASGMDKDTWRDIVQEFIDAEFGDKNHHVLKVAYGLFSGQEPRCFYDVFRPKDVLDQGQNAFDKASNSDGGQQWCRAIAMILANRSANDSLSLTAIGDGLAVSGHMDAAHTCYLLSPQTSMLDSFDTPARYTLIGAHSPQASSAFARDLDGIMLTEIYEFALGLRPQAKGTEPYHGMPHLQAYRALHALNLAELGDIKKALKYCDAIAGVLKSGKMNRYFHPVLLQSLQELQDRLSGDGRVPSGAGGPAAWLKRKPTVDGVWGALEGRFTKFIAGEDEASTDKAPARNVPSVGPFSHYSAITPEADSRGVSRVGSFADFSNVPNQTASSRPGSRASTGREGQFRNGMSPLVPQQTSGSQQNQPYSAWPQGTHVPTSGRALSPSFGANGQSADTDLQGGEYAVHSTGAAPWAPSENGVMEPGDEALSRQDVSESHQDGGYEPHGAEKPIFSSNVQNDDLGKAEGNEDIISPMDTLGGAPVPTFNTDPYAPPLQQRRDGSEDDEEEDDLGFGNKKSRPVGEEDIAENSIDSSQDKYSKAQSTGSESPESKGDSHVVGKKEGEDKDKNRPSELKPQSSWLGRLWGGRRETSENEPKAHKAHLGEATSFYYDKDLKRWVNKKSGDTPQAATPPPPPPRSASGTPSVGRNTPPPPRSASSANNPPSDHEHDNEPATPSPHASPAMDTESGNESFDSATHGPPSGPARQRSKLADHSQPPAMQPPSSRPGPASESGVGGPLRAPPSAAPSSAGPPPAATRAASAAKKKPIGKRYVRVD